jgi:surface antigen
MFDKKKFVSHTDSHEFARSMGKCATHVRQALQTAGIDTSNHPMDAKDYGPYREMWGFQPIPNDDTPQIGDIAVIQPTAQGRLDGIGPEGHIAAFDGFHWVSDWQQRDVWGGAYRRDHLPVQYYRHQ